MSASLRPERAPVFAPPYAEDETVVVRRLLSALPDDAAARARVDAHGSRLIAAIRDGKSAIGGVEDFLKAYSLTTREGLAIMVMAEALLRVPDGATADRLIEDKLARRPSASTARARIPGWWRRPAGRLASPPACFSRARRPENVITGLVKRLGHAAGARRHAAGHEDHGAPVRAGHLDRGGAVACPRSGRQGLPPFL
jgi:hypothetical protein